MCPCRLYWGSCIREIGWRLSKKRTASPSAFSSYTHLRTHSLNMRTTISIYRQLGAFIDDADAAYAASLSTSTSTSSSASTSTAPSTASSTPPRTPNGNSSTAFPPAPESQPLEDPSIDRHFRSGVYLGVGMCNIILSLMPGKLATLVELFGYKGDRKLGLETLMRAGGWSSREGESEPAIRSSRCSFHARQSRWLTVHLPRS